MSTQQPLPDWPRPHFKPGGGDAHLFYKIHGRFSGPPRVSQSEHRTTGLPPTCSLESFPNDSDAFEFGLGDFLGKELETAEPELYRRARDAESCVILQGVVPDPSDLSYLRDTIGLITALLDSGGQAVFDPYAFRWWSADEWRASLFEASGLVPHDHVTILVSEEENGTSGRWFHTRGLLKFGRPDLSVHGVATGLEAGAVEIFHRLIEIQVLGAVVPDGQEIRIGDWPGGYRCRLEGDLDDPDFNNRHLELRRD